MHVDPVIWEMDKNYDFQITDAGAEVSAGLEE
jgi:hypothetical protein